MQETGLAQPAGLGWRAGARLVDAVTLAWLVAVVLVEVEGHLFGVEVRSLSAGQLLEVVVPIAVVFELVPTAVRGVSFGKAMLGLRVVDATAGGHPGFARATVRFLCLYPALLLGPLGLAVVATVAAPAAIDPAGRGLHDRAAGTIVIRTRGT